MNMKCQRVEDRITAYLLGDLNGEDARRIEEHLESCPKCRAIADELKPTIGLLRQTLAAPSAGPEKLDNEHRAGVLNSKPARKRNIFEMSDAIGIPLRVAALLIASIGIFIAVLPVLNTSHDRGELIQAASNGRNLVQSLMSKETQDIYTSQSSVFPRTAPAHHKVKSEVGAVDQKGWSYETEEEMVPVEVEFPKPQFQGTPTTVNLRNHKKPAPARRRHEDKSGFPFSDPRDETLIKPEVGAVGQKASWFGYAGGKGAGEVDEVELVMVGPETKDMGGVERLREDIPTGRANEKMPVAKDAYAKSRSSVVSGDASYADISMPPEPVSKRKNINMPAEEAGMDVDGDDNVRSPLVLNGLFAGRGAVGRAMNLGLEKKSESRPEPSSKPEGSIGGQLGGYDKKLSKPKAATRERESRSEASRKLVAQRVIRMDQKQDVEIDELLDTDEERDESDGKMIAHAWGVNPFIASSENAFSTFSVDCDTASYTMARRYLREGRLPPPETVRTEEFVNFFDYRYPPPRNRLFGIYTECAPSPFGRGLHLINIGVKGRRQGRDQQRPAVLTFVIDTSGSMNTPDRIGLVRLALERLVSRLAPQDEVAIVAYGSQARLMLGHTRADQKEKIMEAIKSLNISGSTHLESGLLLGYQQAARHFRSGAVNRVILLSDGKANLGSDKAEEILAQVAGYRKQGIFCSIFGFGTGSYNDQLLEALADKGDGTYSFIDSGDEVERVFVEDLNATLQVIARDAKIQVEFDPSRVVRYRQIGYENRQLRKQDFRNDSVDAGEIGSGQSVTALYEVELKGVSDAPLGIVRMRAFDTDAKRVVEIDAPINPPRVEAFEQASPRFKLAATAATAAEMLRGSPYANGIDFEALLKTARPLAQELYLDQNVQELLRLIKTAQGAGR